MGFSGKPASGDGPACKLGAGSESCMCILPARAGFFSPQQFFTANNRDTPAVGSKLSLSCLCFVNGRTR
jgi:hypothetical protein